MIINLSEGKSMAYYCGECKVWLGSSDVDRYGRRWCSYSRKYEESNQQTYGCNGFVYVGRVVLTEICNVLQLPTCGFFAAFDEAKAHAIVPENLELLPTYGEIGSVIVDRMHQDNEREFIASQMMKNYIVPAVKQCEEQRWHDAVDTYRTMIHDLMKHYQIA